MKTNIISIIGAIIALIGLFLPWWTVTFSETDGTNLYSTSIYLYQTTTSGVVVGGTSVTGQMNLWYGWVAFALLVLGALLGIAGSLIQARMIVIIGAILGLLSAITFAAGLQNDISTAGLSSIGLFSSGSLSGYNYATYLSYGFWLALIGAIVMLVASLKKPKATSPTAIPPPPPAQEKTDTSPS